MVKEVKLHHCIRNEMRSNGLSVGYDRYETQKCYLSLVMNADSIYVQLYGLNLSTVLQDILTLHMFQHI